MSSEEQIYGTLNEESKTIIRNAINDFVDGFIRSDNTIGYVSFVLRDPNYINNNKIRKADIINFINSEYTDIKAEKITATDDFDLNNISKGKRRKYLIRYNCSISKVLISYINAKITIEKFNAIINDLQSRKLIHEYEKGCFRNINTGRKIRDQIINIPGYNIDYINNVLLADYPNIKAKPKKLNYHEHCSHNVKLYMC